MTAASTSLPESTVDRFRHGTFFYRDDAAFLAGLLPFVREGLARDEVVVVAEPRPRLDQLRDALGSDATEVEFLDMAEVGVNPARIIPVWRDAVDKHIGSGRGLRGVGEPAYVGRRIAEFAECDLHELLLNDAFDGGPAWDLLCPYDEAALPPEVCARALASHPYRFTATGAEATAEVHPASVDRAFAAALPAPRTALRGEFGPNDVRAVRRTIGQFGTSCGLPREPVEDLLLAATELASNCIRHGGGRGRVAMWTEPGAAVIEFRDAGRLADPMVGRHRPTIDQAAGRGLYLVHQLCDLVQVRSGTEGTTVRVTSWL